MSVYVRDTAAAKSLRAMVIFKGARKVATVQVHFGNSGSCLVNIWQETEAAARSAAAREKAGKPFKPGKYETAGAFQHARAGGYGYDKLSQAVWQCLNNAGIQAEKVSPGNGLTNEEFEARGYVVFDVC